MCSQWHRQGLSSATAQRKQPPTILLRYYKASIAFLPFLPTPPLLCPVCLLMKTKEIKLQKTYSWNGFIHRCRREKHITSYVSIRRHLSHTLPRSLPFSLSVGLPFQTRDPSYTCPAAWNLVNAPLFLPLYLNKMIHFSIMAMSVWNELYNQ